MFKKISVLWVLCLALSFWVSGCGIMNGPSVCDDVSEPSVLCDLSVKAGIRLENVGNMLIIVNAISIGEGLYSRGDALEVLAGLRSFIEGPNVSYGDIRGEVNNVVSKYPGLFTVADIYIQSFDIPDLISKKDRRILATWLDNRIRSLN